MGKQCWELFPVCVGRGMQTDASWDLQCIVGIIQPIIFVNHVKCWESCANGSNIVAPRFGDPIALKKCWESLVQKFDRFQTLRNYTPNNMQPGVFKCTQHLISYNVRSCWPTMLRLLQGASATLTFITPVYQTFKQLCSHGSLVLVPRGEKEDEWQRALGTRLKLLWKSLSFEK